jgi:hypothetical protein
MNRADSRFNASEDFLWTILDTISTQAWCLSADGCLVNTNRFLHDPAERFPAPVDDLSRFAQDQRATSRVLTARRTSRSA